MDYSQIHVTLDPQYNLFTEKIWIKIIASVYNKHGIVTLGGIGL